MLFSQLTSAVRCSASFIIVPPPLTPKAKSGYSEGNINKVLGRAPAVIAQDKHRRTVLGEPPKKKTFIIELLGESGEKQVIL